MTEKKENRMGVMPVGKLLFAMSTPMVISFLVQSLYNIVDSIFVARYSPDALAAVSLAYPIQILMIAVSVGTGVGVNALLSRSLGEGKKKKAKLTADNAILLGILASIMFALFGVLCTKLFFDSQTKSESIRQLGYSYLSVVTIFSFGLMLEVTFERILQSTGKTVFNMITQSVGAIINIILDPILIFGFFGAPKLGIAGAAIATVAGQIIAMILSFIFNMKYNEDVDIRFGTHIFIPDFGIIKQIYKVGIPSIAMQAMSTLMILGLNKILVTYSDMAVNVLGIYYKLQSFVFMPIFGLNNGMTPIVAFNYGAKNKDRIVKVLKYSFIASIVIMVIGTAIFWLFPKELMMLFNPNEEMMKLGIPALRICSLCFILAAFDVIAIATFQSLGNGMYALYASFLRQLVLILPFAYALSKISGLGAVWYSIPLAELGCAFFDIYLMKKIYKQRVANL
ncbi:MATE efflux family protein [Lachnoanaerobaculum saburreum F0468]|jgi:MATE efflux family protein|uniref:Probable multidrug resistance protein NorM n=1 Tax=Lachnoanaerobaculum saburreum F0468 TaxID=1095750 RepID=I0R9K6_9FIRM|nr:MATE family efflux transporter [Lachnoanaerobaculum saburreum]EIC96364.1 MATE efflux family protein [Lachnoanaerobaculum saburreum F0468]